MKTYGSLVIGSDKVRMHLHVAETLILNSVNISAFAWIDQSGVYTPACDEGRVFWFDEAGNEAHCF